jgi:formate dehydrogenase major subunit
MKVRTQSPQLQELRKGVMELYISDHPLDCLTCSSNGDCELQDMAGVVGLREVRYGMDGANHFKGEARAEVDTSNPISTTTPASALSAIAACAPARKRRARLR